MYSRSLGTSPHSLFCFLLTPLCFIFRCRFPVLSSALGQGQCATTDTLKNSECPHFTPETTRDWLEIEPKHKTFLNFMGELHTMHLWCGKISGSFFFFFVTLIVFSCCFRLYLKGHSGTAGKQSSLILHGAEFSTKDADNDNCMCKCALMLTGGEYNNSENTWYIDRNLLFS